MTYLATLLRQGVRPNEWWKPTDQAPPDQAATSKAILELRTDMFAKGYPSSVRLGEMSTCLHELVSAEPGKTGQNEPSRLALRQFMHELNRHARYGHNAERASAARTELLESDALDAQALANYTALLRASGPQFIEKLGLAEVDVLHVLAAAALPAQAADADMRTVDILQAKQTRLEALALEVASRDESLAQPDLRMPAARVARMLAEQFAQRTMLEARAVEYRRLEAEIDASSAALRGENATLQQAMVTLRNELDAAGVAASLEGNRSAEQGATIGALESQVDALQAELKQSSEAMTALEQTLEALRADERAASDMAASIRKSLDALQSETNAKLLASAEVITTAQAQLGQTRASFAELGQTSLGQQRTIATLQSEIAALGDNTVRLQQRMTSQTADADTQVAGLRAQSNTLQQTMATQQRELEVLRARDRSRSLMIKHTIATLAWIGVTVTGVTLTVLFAPFTTGPLLLWSAVIIGAGICLGTHFVIARTA